MSVETITERQEVINKNPPITFPYELDTFQLNAINSIEKGNNVLVTAHTSAGKSTVAEYGIAKAISLGKKVIYTSPIKTLSNQKFNDFKKTYESVGILTGDIKQNPDSDVLVMTTEILRNMLFKNSETINDLFCIVFDEVHYINDMDRGHVWEETIIMIPQNIQIIMLSATIENSETVCKWISLKGKNIDIVGTKFRPVPLSHNIYVDGELTKVMGNNKKFLTDVYEDKKSYYSKFFKKYISYDPYVNKFIEELENKSLLPCIFFSYSRVKCEKFAKMVNRNLITHEERREIEVIFNKYIKGIFNDYERLEQTQTITKLLQKGIGFHHSGLVHPLKEIQEILFSKGLIKILFATETFAVGVNMPAKCVVFTELTKFDGYVNNFRYLNTSEYLQMAGRAGRRGKDTEGTVIYFPLKEVPNIQEIRSTYTGNSISVKSKLKLNTKFLLKVIESGNYKLEKFLNMSLLQDENKIVSESIKQKYKENKETLDSYHKFNIENKEFKPEVDEYFKLNNELNSAKSNKRKKLLSRINLIKSNRDIKKEIDVMEKYFELKNKFNESESSVDNCELVTKLNSSKNFLTELKYLTNSDDISLINRKCLTMKGIMASGINECNEILLIEIINEGILNDLTFEEIFSLMAIFIEERTEDEVIVSDLEISHNVKYLMPKIEEINNYLHRIASLNMVYFNSEINKSFLESSYKWACQVDFKEIFEKQSETMFEGNFVKNIIKVLNICTEMSYVCELVGNTYISEVLENMESKIIRDIVSFKSLYLYE